MMEFAERLFGYARKAVPIVFVANAIDLTASVVDTVRAVEDDFQMIYVWDLVKGIYVNSSANSAEAAELLTYAQSNGSESVGYDTRSPMSALYCMSSIVEVLTQMEMSGKGTGNTALFVFTMGDRMFDADDNSQYLEAVQVLINNRDKLKSLGCMCVFVGVGTPKVPELTEHIKVIDAPLPDKGKLIEIVSRVQDDYVSWFGAASDAEKNGVELNTLNSEQVEQYADVLKGMSKFCAEQTAYTSADANGIRKDLLLENAISTINKTQGLSVYAGDGAGFDALGGLDAIKAYTKKLIAGNLKLKVICYMDEIEKTLAGSTGGDSSGVSQGFLGALLSEMQDTNALGLLFTGVYGTAKSAFAKRFGEEADCLTIHLDLSGMKDSLVGKSENNLRQALKVIRSIGGTDGNILYIATCNRISQLPAELKRRFNLGTFFFTFPNKEERKKIWRIYAERYKIKGTDKVSDEKFTGAEIESACRLAYLMQCPIEEAINRIVPVAVTAKEEIDKLISEAHGRYLSTSVDGVFNAHESVVKEVASLPAGRKFRA